MKAILFSIKDSKKISGIISLFLVLYVGAASAQILPSTLNSMKQSATGLHPSAGNHHTIACYPDGALTYYEFIDESPVFTRY